jgi:hypothetical protein
MSPHQSFTRIPLQIGSELRIRNSGEISVSNPTLETGPDQQDADAILDYRFDAHTAEHVLRLVRPPARSQRKRAALERTPTVRG